LAAGITWTNAEVRLNTNTPGYDNSDSCAIAAAGSNVYVVWEDTRNGNEDIYLNYSNNHGVTWRNSDIRLDTNTAGASRSISPEVAASGSNVYVVWYDNRDGSYTDIYMNYSNDAGHTWQASDIRLNTDSAGTNYAHSPKIVATGDKVYVVWQDSREGSTSATNLYLNYSHDAGANWLASDKRIDHRVGEPYEVSLYAEGNNVYVCWDEYGDSYLDIFFTRSTDSGATWLASDTRINNTSLGDCSTPRMAVHGNNIHITWDRYYNYSNYFYWARSSDGGVTWPDSDTLIANTANGNVAVGDTNVSVLYPYSNQLLVKSKPDDATDWTADPVVARTQSAASCADWLFLAQGSNVFAVWEDQICIDQSIYFNYSLDNGQTFLEYAVPLNTTACSGTWVATATTPAMAASDQAVYVAWEDARNAYKDVYIRVGRLGGALIGGVLGLLLQ
jgi:hypothetical protein